MTEHEVIAFEVIIGVAVVFGMVLLFMKKGGGKSFDFDGKNWAIRILFTLEIVFFVVSIALSLGIRPETRAMGQKVWEVFMGANAALFILLNAEGKKQIGLPDDLPVNTQVQQTTTLKQESTVSTPEPETKGQNV